MSAAPLCPRTWSHVSCRPPAQHPTGRAAPPAPSCPRRASGASGASGAPDPSARSLASGLPLEAPPVAEHHPANASRPQPGRGARSVRPPRPVPGHGRHARFRRWPIRRWRIHQRAYPVPTHGADRAGCRPPPHVDLQGSRARPRLHTRRRGPGPPPAGPAPARGGRPAAGRGAPPPAALRMAPRSPNSARAPTVSDPPFFRVAATTSPRRSLPSQTPAAPRHRRRRPTRRAGDRARPSATHRSGGAVAGV